MKLSFRKIAGLACALLLGANVQAQSLTASQQEVLVLAAELYPDLFNGNRGLQQAQGYTYLTYNSGVAVGFKDSNLFLTGGPWGSQITNMGTVSSVTTKLTNAKNSLAVTPTTAMNDLFTYAAQVYPNIFTNGTEFKVDASGYLYKYFADSGVYAAIKDGSVYVRGGSFGNVYTSVGALNNLIGQLQAAVNGNGGGNNGGGTIPEGDFNLTATGTVTAVGVTTSMSFSIPNFPAPDTNDHDAIKQAFLDSLEDAEGTGNLTITNFSYTVVSNTSSLIEYNVEVSASVTASGFSLPYTYKLNYKYTK